MAADGKARATLNVTLRDETGRHLAGRAVALRCDDAAVTLQQPAATDEDGRTVGYAKIHNLGGGNIVAWKALAVGYVVTGLAGADVDGDGVVDVVATGQATRELALYVNNGDGTLQAVKSYPGLWGGRLSLAPYRVLGQPLPNLLLGSDALQSYFVLSQGGCHQLAGDGRPWAATRLVPPTSVARGRPAPASIVSEP